MHVARFFYIAMSNDHHTFVFADELLGKQEIDYLVGSAAEEESIAFSDDDLVEVPVDV